jgi:sulfur-oxidizing protein SoxB
MAPLADAGARISNMMLNGAPIEAGKSYKVAGWASMQQQDGEPIWDVVARWLRSEGKVRSVNPNQPTLSGVTDNQGIA